MAEIVQQVIETSIQDLSILERYEIFDQNEIRLILKKRREFEYRLRKVRKTKDDFLRYIAYEENLLKLVRIRRDKSGLEVDKNEIEKSIKDHIRNLFEFSINKFKADVSLWLSYIDYCKKQNMYDHVSAIYFRMLQIHNKDWLWLQFAKYEFEEKASSETARKIFLKAINFHSDSKCVWYEYFRFELLYCSKIRKRFKILTSGVDKSELIELQDKQTSDAIWNGKLAIIVYNHAINVFADFAFAAKFVSICNNFDFESTKEVKNFVLQDLKSRFGSCEKYWDLVARDKMATYVQVTRNVDQMNESQLLSLKQEAFLDAIAIYESACLQLDNATMWAHYIQFRLEDLRNSTDQQAAELKLTEIMFTLEKLWLEHKVTSEVWLDWVQLMYAYDSSPLNSKLLSVTEEASRRWPTDLKVHLFIACFQTKLPVYSYNVEKFFDDTLYRKFTQVTEENLTMVMDLWELYLDWAIKRRLPYRKVSRIIVKLNAVCSTAPRAMANHFKVKTLAILYHIYDIHKAREHYEKYKNFSPICKSFFFKMLDIEHHFSQTQEVEESNENKHALYVSNIYEDLVHHFGDEDIQIWLAYIRHTMSRDMAKVGSLYEKALKRLNPSACHQFVQQYSLLKSGSVHV